MKVEPDILNTAIEGVACPSCGTPVDIEAVLEAQIEDRLRQKYTSRFQKAQKALEEKQQILERERLDIKQLSAQTWDIIQEKLKVEKIRLAEQIKERTRRENSQLLDELQEELKAQKEKNMELRRLEVQLLQREEELKTIREDEALKHKKLMLERQEEMQKAVRSKMSERIELLTIEYEKRLADQKKLVETMSQKIEQGSMKLQGEAQEIAIETYLMKTYPMDSIVPIKAGVRGGDCIMEVKDANLANSGRLYFESKRTKTFQKAWIAKFKEDMLRHKADIGVIVTKSMPAGSEELTQLDGIWVCSFKQFRSLVPVLRASLLRLFALHKQIDNSHDKMGLIYNYLVSSEFRLQIESIINGFSSLREDLEKEKRAMHTIWNKREKQLERVILSTAAMYGSIQGLAGGDVQEIEALHFHTVKNIT